MRKSIEEEKRRPFLANIVPNMSFDDISINVQGPGSAFNPNGGLGLEVVNLGDWPAGWEGEKGVGVGGRLVMG